MGINIQSIVTGGPRMKKEKTLASGWVWIVFRRDPKTATSETKDGQPRGHDWHLQGCASNEEAAIRMCLDKNYIIGPIPVDTALPHNRIEWVGSYFPLDTNPIKGKKDDTV